MNPDVVATLATVYLTGGLLYAILAYEEFVPGMRREDCVIWPIVVLIYCITRALEFWLSIGED